MVSRYNNVEESPEVHKWRKAFEHEQSLRLAEQRKRIDADMRLKFAKAKLKDKAEKTTPYLVDYETDEIECEICWADLQRDWDFCPSCGAFIDWDALKPPEPDEGYMFDMMRDDQLTG